MPTNACLIYRAFYSYFYNYNVAHVTCMDPGLAVLSIRLATLTVLPHISYWGFLAPMTPATTGPTLIPTLTSTSKLQCYN